MALQHIPPLQCLLTFEALARLHNTGRGARGAMRLRAAITPTYRESAPDVENFIELKFFPGVQIPKDSVLRRSDVDLRAKRVHTRRAIMQGHEKATTMTHISRQVLLTSRRLNSLTWQRC